MRTAYSVETVRAAERELMARLAEGALMQRAAAGLAAACADLLGRVYGSRIVLLVGSGDNGGDALYAGARLARRGAGVTAVLLVPERTHGAGLAALRRAGGTVAGSGAAEELILRADLVVDGIVGIGGKGGLRPEAVPLAAYAADSRAAVVAVDLPSGIEADTGEVLGTAVRADLTVTFGTHKPGLLIDPGREYAGSVRLVDIGLELPEEAELEALQHMDVAARLPVPGAESDKYRRGVVGIAAGSARYPGAAVLAVSGALRGGAGAVRYVGPAADAVISRFPETLVSDQGPARAGRVQAWVVGPGVGDDASAVAQVLGADVPVLVDADGLRLADRSAVRARTAPTLMTPHAGEAAALLGVSRESVEGARLSSARELALRYGATVLLKGSTTLVADPAGGAVRVNPTGTAWLATAGSGDVLSGLAGSLLAAGLSALDAGSVGAYLHGLAGRLAADGAPLGAHDVAAAIPEAWRDVRDALR
ncbi:MULTISPECIES: NAD(P)H-hydrate dehydratase [unclassified Streptomyces]|uniref:NAD(P)H-hydrate dehydratase n=1 Tax=unclassified Streptomyces TaxID=2593676 RepID=UPI001161EF13|nr:MULTISPECIES: NAD(P)H-hydrate dehydratase [unclassified Streptomyces]NMI60330.1 NAD(P)H-hydrate dehydratase [Streptomyces sp. RLA2-12]QDN59510.1 NAD(P)H-hydrate dehydratase [Streptomyces sp. S1D4-20]QDN69586.1 NAD(P)H-hydrate dehydratase [Streptomyces sp. S1D4-14]QDO52057.1 NAD(P)H-hydrate dehydratase [Streptomyces sp. RLB3-5]QDO62298.1 NAD(P)H-hydrate dehydratase [Streptomyces sp. RLB1-8]